MSFVTWAALAAAALIVAPLVAHLLRRRPPDEEPFAATKLVPVSPAVAQRRTALEDRALLAIRVLAVVALAVLGATPLLRCSRLSLARTEGASVALAIVLDDSLSMRAALEPPDASGAPSRGPSRFDRAREAAEELLAGLQPGDAVAIVLAGEPVRVALAASTNLDAARAAVARATQSDRATDLDAAVDIAAELLSELQHVDKRVVVLSDLASGDGASQTEGGEVAGPLRVPAGVKLWLPLEELRGARRNCGVVHADKSGATVSVRVACGPGPIAQGATSPGTAGAEQAARRIAVVRGNEVLTEAPLRLDSGASDLALGLPEDTPEDPALHLYAELRGDPDAIASDDSAPVVSIGGTLQVGVVSDVASSHVPTGGPPAVEQAFKSLALGLQLRPLSAVPEHHDDLGAFGLLIMDDVPGFTPAQRRELGQWVEEGGVLLLTLGPGAAAAPLGSSFAPMLDGIVRWSKEAPPGIDPNTDAFFGESVAGLDDLRPIGRALLDLERDQAPTTLAAWSDGAPFLLEKRMGRGVVYAVTLPFDTGVSELALRPGFLELLHRLTVAARTLGGVARTRVGIPWPLDGFEQTKVERLGRDDRTQAVEVEQAGKSRRAVAHTAGLYLLTLDANTTTRVAAISEREVDLRPRAAPDSGDDQAMGGVGASVDVSAYVAVLLIALMFAELLLRVLSPRVRPRGEDTPPSSRAR